MPLLRERTDAASRLDTRESIGFALAAMLAFGIASVAIGQDTNWDLRNYHRYNPWALLNGRLAIDLAPAGMPSYFNPLLDLPHWWASQWMDPRALAFVMGALQGLNVLIVARIARLLLPDERRATIAAIALAGCMSSAFLSELGNTMGDNLTCVAMLAAFAMALAARLRPPRAAPDDAWRCLLAGLVAGAGIGAKLTNLPYGIGLVASVAVRDGDTSTRAKRVVFTGLGLAIGVALTYGFWAWMLGSQFGSPTFPQFNRLFGAPLAAETMVVDDRWLPQDWIERALFPFVFTAFPMRVSEWPIVNALWPVGYVLLWTWALRVALRIVRHGHTASRDALADARGMLLVFVVVAYLAWMSIFAIGRYAIAIELLLPLGVWLLLHALAGPRFPRHIARRVALGLVAFTIAFPLLRFDTWGSGRFDRAAYRVDVPPFDDPSRSTVLVLTAPVAWMLPDFPAPLAFASLDSGFPESPRYVTRVRETIAARGGPVYAILPVDRDDEGSGRWKLNRLLRALSVGPDDLLCRYARAIMRHAPATDVTYDASPASDGAPATCRFRRDPGRDPRWARDAHAIADAMVVHGLEIDLARCRTYDAWIGERSFPYRFCPVSSR